MTTLRSYPEYTTANVDWFGNLPSHWRTAALGRIARASSGGTPPMERREYWEREVPWVSSKDMKRDRIDDTQMWVSATAIQDGKTGFAERGAVLMVVRSGILRHTIPVAITLQEVAFNQDVKAFAVDPRALTPEYLTALIHGNQAALLTLWSKQGATVESLEVPWVLATQVPLPPLDEQRAIADFLDAMDARITRFIAARRRMIALLEEQKAVIITQAVTRGLDPDVPLKPSGIDWLGEVPAHWEVRRIKSIAQETDMRTQTGTEDLLSLRMREGLIPHNTASEKPINAESLVGYKRVLPGQLVMNRMRASVGLFAVSNHKGLVSPDYAVYTLETNVDADFLVQLLKTPMMRSEFRRRSTGLGTGESGFLRLYSDDFGNVLIALPGTDEQRRLVREIRSNTGNVDRIAKRTQREIELVHEYHTRLISDVVTGQLDVRGVDLPAVKEVVDASVESIAAEWQPVGEVVE